MTGRFDATWGCYSCKRRVPLGGDRWQLITRFDFPRNYCNECAGLKLKRIARIQQALGDRLTAELAGKPLPPWPEGCGPEPEDPLDGWSSGSRPERER